MHCVRVHCSTPKVWRRELQAILDSVFADDVHAWALAEDGSWSPVTPRKPEKVVDHQSAMMKRAELRARRQPPPRAAKKT